MPGRLTNEFLSDVYQQLTPARVLGILALLAGYEFWLFFETGSIIENTSGGRNASRMMQSRSYVLLSTTMIHLLEGFSLIGVLYGATTFASDHGSGRLRYLLSQPIRRTEFFLARSTRTLMFIIVAFILFFGCSFGLLYVRLGFGPAVDPDFPSKVMISRSVLFDRYLRLLLIGLLPVLAASMFGTLISIFCNQATTALSISLFAYLILRILGTYPADWVSSVHFLGALDRVTSLARNLGNQVTTAPSTISEFTLTHPMILTSIATVLVFTLLAWQLFLHRDLR